ncbi:hypothetical protein [Natronoglycomyces albus]|uniref:Uncharacterized protein n=1 Tax=Natronoglycomyces albus TaxID=2811108 RepID=A0A895XG60_9ACTN|nr:hypothetical protein [Natronoglycomyces albus]QSB04851.1 hypothetical protein JQS30_13930 [Natronoglycomyces albus]
MSFKDRLSNAAKQAGEASKSYGEKVTDVTTSATGSVVSSTQSASVRARETAAHSRVSVSQAWASAKNAYDEMDVKATLQRVQLPPYPVSEPWHWSLGQLITAGEKPRRGTGVLLNQLDRFGRIDIGPDFIGFDGRTAKWDKVKALRTRSIDEIVSRLITDGCAESMRGALPPVPGRAWVSKKAVGALFTIWALTAQRAMDEDEAGQQQVLCEIEYKGWIRTKEAQTGWFTGPVMVLIPELDQLFQRETGRRGVPIEPAEPDDSIQRASERADWLRDKQASILKRRDSAIADIERESVDEDDQEL